MEYYIGIDAGGTSTSFSLIEYNGINDYRIIKNIKMPSIHLLHVPLKDARNILNQGIGKLEKCLPEHNIIDGVSVGMAGYGNDSSMRLKIEAFFSQELVYKYKLFSDAEVALEGALSGKDGILLISGTGAICLSKVNDHIYRSGGWGYMIGDEGSGYWLGKRILQLYSMQVDGRRPKTKLYSLVKSNCNLVNDYDIITFVAKELNNNRTKIASLSYIFTELVNNDDYEANFIIEEMSNDLSDLINVHLQLHPHIKLLTYTGGLISNYERLRESIETKLIKKLKFHKSLYGPEIGAVKIFIKSEN
ncbi:hypothetical protein HZY86_03215 [Aerococcaceae bacterium DSM 111020]|nr:hypothetical protein [Aerococcaceae bacterium DSM 111020]